MSSEQVLQFYLEATGCQAHCADIRNDPESGAYPRSFYCPFDPSDVTILIVSKNPGIASAESKAMFASLPSEDFLLQHDQFIRTRFEGCNDMIKSKFHANLIDWVSVILDVEPTHDTVFKQAAKTALAKCESLKDKQAKLLPATLNECATRWLWREIEIIQPKFLLSLGNEVHNYLTRPEVQQIHNLPVGKLQHPSWTNMRGGVKRYKAEVLPALRQQYLEACNSEWKRAS